MVKEEDYKSDDGGCGNGGSRAVKEGVMGEAVVIAVLVKLEVKVTVLAEVGEVDAAPNCYC